MESRDNNYYDVRAQDVKLEDITSSAHNAEILRVLRDGETSWMASECLDIGEEFDDDEEEEEEEKGFVIREGDDCGWLGYFIGRNKHVQHLCIYNISEEQIRVLMKGVKDSRSIQFFDISDRVRGDVIIDSLAPFIISNSNLKLLRLFHVDITLHVARSLAEALILREQKSLTCLSLEYNNLSNEIFEEISTALTGYPYLECLNVSENNLVGRDGCVSMGAIIMSAALYLKDIILCGNDFDDEGLQTLATALTNATTLQRLSLSSNRSITAAGLRALSRLFSSTCPLETLHIQKMNIGDEGAEALADGLRGNTTLKHLVLTPDSAGITSTGWTAFSRLLCDTSSINDTYRSNHTLEHIGDDYYYVSNPNGSGRKQFRSGDVFTGECFRGIPPAVVQYLKINKEYHSLQDAAKIKIGQCHTDIPVEAFFEYKLKFLPLLVSWYGGFATRKCSSHQRREFQRRELSAVYKFIRGMPMLAVDGQMGLKNNSCGRKRKFDE